MKSLSTKKLHNFFRSTTLILTIFSSEVVYRIWISKFKTSNIVLYDKMILNKNLLIIKFHNISGSTTFILVVFPSEVGWKIRILKCKRSFAWQMVLNQNVVNYKLSWYFKTYNFYFGGFPIWGILKKKTNL